MITSFIDIIIAPTEICDKLIDLIKASIYIYKYERYKNNKIYPGTKILCIFVSTLCLKRLILLVNCVK